MMILLAWLHVVAAVTWIGGMVFLSVVVLPVLPVTKIAPGTRSARRLAAAKEVGANSRSALESIAVGYYTNGHRIAGSWLRSPASTCATGTAAMPPASAPPSALEVSPWTTSRSGGSRNCVNTAAATLLTCKCGSWAPGQLSRVA